MRSSFYRTLILSSGSAIKPTRLLSGGIRVRLLSGLIAEQQNLVLSRLLVMNNKNQKTGFCTMAVTTTHVDTQKPPPQPVVLSTSPSPTPPSSGQSPTAPVPLPTAKITPMPYFLPFKDRLPEKAKRYELGRKIGSGNFAVVHEALDKETGEMVAVKIMNKATTPRQLCQQELKILQEIREEVGHKRLTPIKDVFETKDNLCIVLELIRGGDFYDHVVKNGRMKERDAAIIIRKLIYALEALHRHGIIHRDIKLENILLSSSRKDMDSSFNAFKITDFGYARHVTEEDAFTNYAGTIGYAAPEVLKYRQYGTACDVWSAGIVLYTLLAGYPPFPHKKELDPSKVSIDDLVAAEIEAITWGRQEDNWNRQFQVEPWNEISSDAKNLVSGMLRLDPNKRFSTGRVLSDAWIQKATQLQQQEYLNFE